MNHMGFDINKIQTEFNKEKKGLEGKNKAIFEAMKTCPSCQETEVRFVPCKAHMDELKAVGEAMGILQMQTQLKVQMHPVEMQKVMEAQMKVMQTQMGKAQKKPDCKDKYCPH